MIDSRPSDPSPDQLPQGLSVEKYGKLLKTTSARAFKELMLLRLEPSGVRYFESLEDLADMVCQKPSKPGIMLILSGFVDGGLDILNTSLRGQRKEA